MSTYRTHTTSALSMAPIARPAFERFIVLSLLLHMLAMALFGDAQGGAAARGERLWGAFRATLVSNANETAPVLKLARTVEPGSLPARQLPENPPPSISSVPTRVEPITPASSPGEVSATTQAGAPLAPPKPGKLPTAEVLPYLAKEVAKPETSFVVSPPSSMPDVVAPAADKPRLAPLTPLQNAAPVVQSVSAPQPLEEAPLPPLLPLPLPLPAPTIERAPAPAQLLPRILPVAPTPELAPLVPATIERQYAPVAEPLPRLLPVAPAPASAPITLAPARIERDYAPIADLLAPLTPVVPTVPSKRELAPYVVPKMEPEAIPVTLPTMDPSAETVVRPAPRETPLASTEIMQREPPTRNEPESAPGTVAPAQAVTSGAPADPLASRRELSPPLPPVAPAAPRLDLDAMRNRARNMRSEGSGPRTVFQFPTPPPEAIKSKDAKIFDKALKRPDCRDAYAGLGLAAVVPLVADAITNKGCKW